MIIASIVLFHNEHIPPFPNCYTLVPTLGAVLIILFADKDTLVGKLLSIGPIRWVGLISYSAYLWHQPILAFMRLRLSDEIPFWYMLLAVITVFPLSALSYYFVEQPFRDKKRFSRKQIFAFSMISAFMTFIVASALIRNANIRSTINSKTNDTYLSDLKYYGNWQYVERAFNALATQKKTFSNESLMSFMR